jgi:hypothetical protein
MATLKQIRDKADAKLTEFWQLLSAKQDAYFAKHGKYFQLLVTSDVVDGVDTVFEVRKPNDEKNVVDVDFEFNSPIPFQIKVDEWVGWRTTGYSATAIVQLVTGEKYRRTHHSNGEDSGWALIAETNI